MSPATSKQIQVHGLEQVEANIQRLINGNWNDAKKAFLQETNIVHGEAQKETPVEFGVLRRSGSVDEIKETKKEYDLMIGFHTDYAAAVHENLEARHPKGKAKYLEDPLMARVDDIPKNIAKRIRAGMKV